MIAEKIANISLGSSRCLILPHSVQCTLRGKQKFYFFPENLQYITVKNL